VEVNKALEGDAAGLLLQTTNTTTTTQGIVFFPGLTCHDMSMTLRTTVATTRTRMTHLSLSVRGGEYGMDWNGME